MISFEQTTLCIVSDGYKYWSSLILFDHCTFPVVFFFNGGHRCRDRDCMVVRFTTTCTISCYHH